MEEAVCLWPQSQYAHAGLAYALIGDHVAPDVKPTPADKRRAADELLLAAEIAFKQGKTPDDLDYGFVLPNLLAKLGDKAALDRYFERVFGLVPEGEGRYRSYYEYAQALDQLGDERAETYLQKAIKISPEGLEEPYYGYTRYLLKHHKAQAVLELLVPNSPADQLISKPDFHYFRCQALEQVGRKVEAAEACQKARDLTPPRGGIPVPAERPGSGPSSRGPRAPTESELLASLLGADPYHP
jgi:tetratricopeptide (TPR) repeat protein